jgi:hypothetical protein
MLPEVSNTKMIFSNAKIIYVKSHSIWKANCASGYNSELMQGFIRSLKFLSISSIDPYNNTFRLASFAIFLVIVLLL